MIYIVEAQNGLCKIGQSRNPQRRAETIHAHSAVPVRLIAQWHGGRQEEMSLHVRMKEYRSHSEWFRVEGDAAFLVEQMRGLGVDRIVEWSEITWASAGIRRALQNARHSAAMKNKWSDPAFKKEQREWRAQRREQRNSQCRLHKTATQ